MLSINETAADATSSEAMQSERKVLMTCEAKIQELADKYPDWWALYEDALPDTAPRGELIELMDAAPNDFALALVYGKFTLRIEIAAITGRSFK